ncbi:hypothetical protein [Phormidium nigroviride]
MRHQLVEEFKILIEPFLPSYLVIFDLADTKRRNLYLGLAEKVIKSRGWEMKKSPVFLT